MALLLVGLLLMYLYVNPLRTYVATLHEEHGRSATVAELQREHRVLQRRDSALRRPGSVELEARRLGMVRPTEHAYVVKGLPHGN